MRKRTFLPVIAVLVIGAFSFGTRKAPAQSAPSAGSVAFDVTWKLNGKGNGGYINLEFKARYTARKLENPINCVVEWTSMVPRAGIKECYLLSYESGHMTEGAGHMDPDPKPAVIEDGGCPSEGPPAINPSCLHGSGGRTPQEIAKIKAGYLFVDKNGKAEFLLLKGPSYKADGAGEAASGCLLMDKFPPLVLDGVVSGDLYQLEKNWHDERSFDPEVPDCKSQISIEIQASCIGINALDLFTPMMPAFKHPRCLNCHGVVDPLTGANHGGGKVDAGPQNNGRGITTPMGNGTCLQCHTAGVKREATGEESGPWFLAPALMSFVGKEPKTLCEQVSDFGFPDPTDPPLSMQHFHDHIVEDPRIGLGFEGLSGGAAKKPDPPPMNRQQFVALAMKWATQGRHECTCITPASGP